MVRISIIFTFLPNPVWWVFLLVADKGVVNLLNLLIICRSPDDTRNRYEHPFKALSGFSDLTDFLKLSCECTKYCKMVTLHACACDFLSKFHFVVISEVLVKVTY